MRTHVDGSKPKQDEIFVFGSNLAGRHGAGAAKFAKDHFGAVYGIGYGLRGNSFAIPTKDRQINTMAIEQIYPYIEAFNEFVVNHPEINFFLTRVGCGLAGYSDADIAPKFRYFTNVNYPDQWVSLIQHNSP